MGIQTDAFLRFIDDLADDLDSCRG